MPDDDKYLRVFPAWQKTIESLPGLGVSKNALLRVWHYGEIEQYPTSVVLWKMARGYLPVRNLGQLGRERLRNALRENGIPEPKVDSPGNADRVIKITLTCPPGHAADFDMLAILLRRDIDETEQYGDSIIRSVGYWLDVLSDDLADDDWPALVAMIERVRRGWQRRDRPTPAPQGEQQHD